jgi:hypothetical protein
MQQFESTPGSFRVCCRVCGSTAPGKAAYLTTVDIAARLLDASPDTGETSPRASGLRQREAPHPQAICAGRMLPSDQRYGVVTSEFDPFRCSIPSSWSPL